MSESFERLYRFAPCGLLASTTDGVILEVNETLLELTGFTREQLIGVNFASLLEQGSRMFYETRHLPVLQLNGEVREVVLTLRRTDGSPLNVLVASTYSASGIETAMFDATERAAYERTLLDARRLSDSTSMRLRVLQSATAAFGQSETDTDVCEALAASAHEALDASYTVVSILDDAGDFRLGGGEHPVVMQESAHSESPAARAVRLREPVTIATAEDADAFPGLRDGLRAQRIEAMTVIPLLEGDRVIGVLACSFKRRRVFDTAYFELQAALAGQAVEVLVRLRLQRQLEALAHYDQLTGLRNRELVRDGLSAALRAATSPLAVFFIDLDGFKDVNDVLGHRVGDSVLLQVGERLRATVRSDDVVGRIGGDEFVVVCPGVGEDDALALAAVLCRSIRAPFDGVTSDLPVTASIGIAVHHPGMPSTIDDMLSRADDAMYAAKNAGKDQSALAPAQN
ncbi:diguanylate cyclase [Glaciihabitans arcticus]|uniref:Diguanylate cyclase n=1 Tax=Glaciihabitans arcticus TaxID=2668039 RepID=A0A4Q9GYM7_9MICO|nr:diguanylate cyclase [Glaciihabitans arcticus]TBN57420.1 diguanylate cyclase [Glaciihabitans arcticus]